MWEGVGGGDTLKEMAQSLAPLTSSSVIDYRFLLLHCISKYCSATIIFGQTGDMESVWNFYKADQLMLSVRLKSG